MRALDALWREVASKPLWAPRRFWRYVALRRRMRLSLLDPARVTITAPAGKVNDCSACTEICCVGPRAAVLLHLRDLAALADLGRTDLVARDKPTFSAEELDRRPALLRHTGSRAWAIFPVLKQNGYGACAALTADGTCSLHPHWPLSCARFPYSLRVEEGEVFYSRRCDAFWIRPDARDRQQKTAALAVAAYNERIKDMILLAYAKPKLASLGLLEHLRADRGV